MAFTSRKHVNYGVAGLVLLAAGLFTINHNIKDDIQKQIAAQHYNSVRAGCIAEQEQNVQDLNDFLRACALPTQDDCLATEVGKSFIAGLGEPGIQKCIDREL